MARFPARRIVERADLSVPRGATPRMGGRYDADAFGRFSEAIARFLGTGRFLVGQTVLVIAWIGLNTFGIVNHWDPYPFILLNLAFSTQAAYAAPLILLAQNRQDDRDRANIERDREVAARTQADTEFLARELAAVRLALADVATTEDLEDSLGRMAKLIADQLRDTPGTLTSPDGHLPRHGDQDRPGDGPLPDDPLRRAALNWRSWSLTIEARLTTEHGTSLDRWNWAIRIGQRGRPDRGPRTAVILATPPGCAPTRRR